MLNLICAFYQVVRVIFFKIFISIEKLGTSPADQGSLDTTDSPYQISTSRIICTKQIPWNTFGRTYFLCSRSRTDSIVQTDTFYIQIRRKISYYPFSTRSSRFSDTESGFWISCSRTLIAYTEKTCSRLVSNRFLNRRISQCIASFGLRAAWKIGQIGQSFSTSYAVLG